MKDHRNNTHIKHSKIVSFNKEDIDYSEKAPELYESIGKLIHTSQEVLDVLKDDLNNGHSLDADLINKYGRIQQELLNSYREFVLEDYIEIISSIEKNLNNLKTHKIDEGTYFIKSNIHLRKMKNFLKSFGCSLIEVNNGDNFDTNTMEAFNDYDEKQSYVVSEVISNGYIYRNYKGDDLVKLRCFVEVEPREVTVTVDNNTIGAERKYYIKTAQEKNRFIKLAEEKAVNKMVRLKNENQLLKKRNTYTELIEGKILYEKIRLKKRNQLVLEFYVRRPKMKEKEKIFEITWSLDKVQVKKYKDSAGVKFIFKDSKIIAEFDIFHDKFDPLANIEEDIVNTRKDTDIL